MTSDWTEEALGYLRLLPPSMEGTFEAFRVALLDRRCPAPSHHNGWGALCTQATDRDLLVEIGMGRMRDPKSHGRRTPVYRLPAAPNARENSVKTTIASITIGDRTRRDLGDLDVLAGSIREVGLLQPVVIRSDGRLIAGARRIEACKLLGWDKIDCHIVDLDQIVRGELAENTERKNFLPSEIEAIRRAMAPVEVASAKLRMSDGGKGAKVSQPSRTTDKIGAFAGVSGRTVEKIAEIVKAAEDEPKKYGGLVKDMDRTGKVDGVYQKLRKARAPKPPKPPPEPPMEFMTLSFVGWIMDHSRRYLVMADLDTVLAEVKPRVLEEVELELPVILRQLHELEGKLNERRRTDPLYAAKGGRDPGSLGRA